MQDDDEDNDCLYIAGDIPELMLPVHSNTREPNATDTSTSRNIKQNINPITNNEKTIRHNNIIINNTDTSPNNIVGQLKNFNYLQFRNNHPHIFDESYKETEQGKEQIESNGARVLCKDFARIPFDDGSNLLTPEYLLNSELYAHLVNDTPTTAMSVADVSRNNEAFRPTTNNFTNNARCASDALIQISQHASRATLHTIPPNTVDKNADFHLGPRNTNIFDFIGNPSTSIPLNNGYGIQGENMRINTPAAQNLNVFMPHPGGLSSTTHGTDVFSNSDKLNASINNFGSPVMNMHINGAVPVPPHQSQDLYASEAHRRKMYSDNLAAPSGNYGLNMSACQYARCMRPCAPKTMGFTPTPALPAGYIPRPLCRCPGPCNLHITGPFYPAVKPSFQAQPINQTASRNLYDQALNGNAMPRDDLYIAQDPIRYATYQPAYLANMRRNLLATEQSIIKTGTKQHMVNNIPVAVINQKPKAMATANATRAYTEINTNLSNGGVINVDSNSPAKAITNHSTTTSFSNSCNMAQRWDALRLKNTIKNKRQTKTTKNTPTAKTKAVKKSPRARATTITKDHFQPKNANFGTHADKQNENLHQPSVDKSVALSNMNKYRAAISKTPISEQLKTPTPLNTFEGSNKIESIDLTADSITFNPTTQLRMETSTRHDKMSMNNNTVQTPKTQHTGISIHSENAQIALIVEPSSQHAEKLQPNMQQAGMNMTTNGVQTLITEDKTNQQDNVYEIVENAQASYIKTCETLKNELQISRAVIQARKVTEHPFTAAKKIKHDSAELQSKTNAFNEETGTPLDRTCLANKAQAPIKSEQSKINTNECLQNYKKEEKLITTTNPREDMKKHTLQPAVNNTIGITIPTNANQVKMCMSTETVQTSMNTEVCIQSANKNSNVQSLQSLVPLNKNTEKEDVALCIVDTDFELRPNSLKTGSDAVREVRIQQDNTATNNNMQNALIPLLMKEYPQVANKNQSDVTMQTTIQQTSMDSNTETVQTSISMGTTTQQASNSANMKALALLNSVTQTSRTQTTSNTCNLTYTTTSTENITYNIVSSDFVSSSNNLNPITGLSNSVPRSDTIYNMTQTQVTVQHHEILNRVEHFSIDLLKSILDTAHRNYKSQNTNVAKTESSSHEVNTHQEKTSVIVTEKEIKNHNKNYKCTETIENAYATGTEVSEGNVSCKSEDDDENEKLKIARQRLALISMQSEKRAVQSISAEGNPQNSIVGEYDSIIALVAKKAHILLTSYKISSSEQKKSVDETATFVTNRVKRSAEIKSLEVRKRKILRELAIDAKKRYRCTADIKQKNNNNNSYSRPVKKSAAKTDTKFHQADVAIHKRKNIRETNLIPHGDLFFSFQLEFFGHEEKRLAKKGFKDSAYILSYEIYRLMYTRKNKDAKADIEFTCPKCHHVSIYSPHLFYYKEDVHNLDESNKTVHCQRCIRLRKKYKTALKRYFKQNTTQIEKINDDRDVGEIVDQPKIDTGSNKNNADEDTINSNKELTTQSAYIHQSDITDIADIEETGERPETNIDPIGKKLSIITDGVPLLTDIEETGKRPEINFDPIAEQLSIITDGMPLFPTKAKIDVQNNHSKIKLLVKLPCKILKPSTVDSVIKSKHNTFTENNSTLNIATNDICNKDKNCIIDYEEQKTDSAKTATSPSNPPDKTQNTTINKIYGNVDNNKDTPVTIENADIKTNNERSREVSSLNDVETTNSVNAQLPKINEKNTNDNAKKSAESATSRITQVSNKVMNTENTVNMDNNKNKISRKVRKSLSVETATSTNVEIYEKNRDTETNNNREKKNLKDRKARGKYHEDTANRPNVAPKPKESNTDNDVSQTMNDNEDKNDNQGSETEDDTKSSSETDDDVNEAIRNSFNTLKNNSNEKSELPEVLISGKMKSEISNRHKNYAKVKDEYSFKCHVCSVTFTYLRVYFSHMRNHGIHNERIPKTCIYRTCSICGLKYVQGKAYNTHIQTSHEDIFNKKQ